MNNINLIVINVYKMFRVDNKLHNSNFHLPITIYVNLPISILSSIN
jgi:hypothetical protein